MQSAVLYEGTNFCYMVKNDAVAKAIHDKYREFTPIALNVGLIINSLEHFEEVWDAQLQEWETESQERKFLNCPLYEFIFVNKQNGDTRITIERTKYINHYRINDITWERWKTQTRTDLMTSKEDYELEHIYKIAEPGEFHEKEGYRPKDK